MKQLALLICALSIPASVSIKAGPPQVEILSLNDGTYSYSVSERKLNGSHTGDVIIKGSAVKTVPSEVITYLEIVEEPTDSGIASEALMTQLVLEVAADGPNNNDGIIRVLPKTALDLVADDGGKDPGPVNKMRNGTVKFFNESKKEVFVHVSGLKEEIRENDHIFLLPQELQIIVDEARLKGGRVFILIQFEVQEGKKGLNAVNVKLA
jgi:CspA family cold shock protein